MTKDEALKLALEALNDERYVTKYTHIVEAITAIKEALAAPVQEPRARLMRYIGKDKYPKQGTTVARTYEELPKNTYPDTWEEDEALYTTPPAQPAPVQEPVYLVEDDFGLFRITNKGDYTYWSSTGRHKTFIANATPPEAQRKPLTHDEDNAICEANCNAEADAYFKARPQLDTTENRRIFYAGHRRAWLSYPCLAEAAHGIKE